MFLITSSKKNKRPHPNNFNKINKKQITTTKILKENIKPKQKKHIEKKAKANNTKKGRVR